MSNIHSDYLFNFAFMIPDFNTKVFYSFLSLYEILYNFDIITKYKDNAILVSTLKEMKYLFILRFNFGVLR